MVDLVTAERGTIQACTDGLVAKTRIVLDKEIFMVMTENREMKVV